MNWKLLSSEEQNFIMAHDVMFKKLVQLECTLANEEMTKAEAEKLRNEYKALEKEYKFNDAKYWDLYDKCSRLSDLK